MGWTRRPPVIFIGATRTQPREVMDLGVLHNRTHEFVFRALSPLLHDMIVQYINCFFSQQYRFHILYILSLLLDSACVVSAIRACGFVFLVDVVLGAIFQMTCFSRVSFLCLCLTACSALCTTTKMIGCLCDVAVSFVHPFCFLSLVDTLEQSCD